MYEKLEHIFKGKKFLKNPLDFFERKVTWGTMDMIVRLLW